MAEIECRGRMPFVYQHTAHVAGRCDHSHLRNATLVGERRYAELTNATNGYTENMLNAKIEAPIDDNYSDDQLTFMPYYTLLTTTTDPVRRAPALASLARTWNASRSGRSDLWAAIFMAVTDTRHPGKPLHPGTPLPLCSETMGEWGGAPQGPE